MQNIAAAMGILLTISVGVVRAEPVTALKPTSAIPLAGVQGRIDHMAMDRGTGRLYIAALGNNTVEVIDLKSAKRISQMAGLKTPQGVAVVGETGRVVIASGGDGKVRIYDRDQKQLGTLNDLDDADNVRYEPEAKLIYVGYGEGALAVIDPEKLQKVGDIKLQGHPESFQLESKGKRIFVNVPAAKHVAVIDREKRAVVATWPLHEAEAIFPMALDEAHHRLFIGCRNPAKLLVLDTQTGKLIANVDCVGDTDDVFYDAANSRVYVSGSEGFVTVIETSGGEHYRAVERVATASGARTSFFDSAAGVLYVAVPHRGNHDAELLRLECSRR